MIYTVHNMFITLDLLHSLRYFLRFIVATHVSNNEDHVEINSSVLLIRCLDLFMLFLVSTYKLV